MIPEDSQTAAPTGQQRTLNLQHSIAIVVGSILGVGIFLYPPQVAAYCPSSASYYFIWLLGGLMALAGAATCAELGTMIPRSGGDYRFQREVLGPSISFATGWVLFIGIFSGSIATMMVALFEYQIPVLFNLNTKAILFDYPWGGSLTIVDVGACLSIVFLSLICRIGIRLAAQLQFFLTIVPVLALFIISIYALGLTEALPAAVDITPSKEQGTLIGFISAYLMVYFAYAGWNAVIYIAGDIQDPSQNIPRSLIAGTSFTTLLYLLLCAAFVHVLGYTQLSQINEAGTALAGAIGGSVVENFMTFLIACGILASVNGTIIAGARTGYAMGQDGILFINRQDSWLLSHDGILTLQCFWTCALIVSGQFESLTKLTSLAMLLTGSFTIALVFILRRQQPDRVRPYRCLGYPVLPGIYLLCNLFVLIVMFTNAIMETINAGGDIQNLQAGWKNWYPLLGLVLFITALLWHRFVLRNPSSVRHHT